MSVGKMNQLFGNEGFLVPEKRCSKGPGLYRYSGPRKVKVESRFGGRDESLFRHLEPSGQEVSEPVPVGYSDYFLIYPKAERFEFRNPDLSKNIENCIDLIKASKYRRINSNYSRSVNLEKSTQRALSSISKDILTISKLSEEMSTLKNLIINYA